MIPFIDFDLKKLCSYSLDIFHGAVERPISITYAFDYGEMESAALAHKFSLDRYLTLQILYGLSQKPVKSKLVFFYTPAETMCFISVAGRKKNIQCDWLTKLSGFVESGQQHVPENAKPIIYWDGLNVNRIYGFPTELDEDCLYGIDFGNIFGVTIEPIDVEMATNIKQNPIEYVQYSIVPNMHEEVIEYKDKRLILLHSAFIDNDMDDEIWE